MGLAHRAGAFVARTLPLKLARSQLARPVASMTFDDFPRSAWTRGGPILAEHGARATYYAAGRFEGATEEGRGYYTLADLRALVAAGHEVGAHSFGHDMAPHLSARALVADAARNAQALEPRLGARLTSYAYPYGEVSAGAKACMGARFATARGIRPGVNAGLIDLAQLKAVPLEARRWIPAEIEAAVEAAAAVRGWVIFFTHDVDEAPSPFGATPAMLAHALGCVRAAGIDCVPVRQAMARAVFGEG